MGEAASDTMSEEIAANSVPRSWSARIGVSALNLITPGLGLVRIGRWRAGLLAAILPGLILLGLAVVGAAAPPIGFHAFVVAVGLLLVGSAVLYGFTLTTTWRGSGNRDRSADSRVPPDEFGAGMVPEKAVLGRALFILWGHSNDRSGANLN